MGALLESFLCTTVVFGTPFGDLSAPLEIA
jgi:hypothetical protein